MKNAINYDFGSLSIQTFFDSVTLTAKSRIRWDDVVMDELTYAARSADDAVDKAVRFATEKAQIDIIG
jgi:hypothetical protein